MYKVTVTKEITSGILKGITVQDTFTSSKAQDKRVIGKTYKSATHTYKVISIEYTYQA